jgi:hypothetical protein
MRSLIVCAAALVAASSLAGPAAAALPQAGVLLPGRSLGGIRLGESPAGVRASLGRFYGVCRGCATTTWYFTYRRFDQRGLAIEFTGGRVSAVYTLWQSNNWSTRNGLHLGAVEAQLTTSVGPLVTVVCPGYDARVADGTQARSVYYVVQGKLWGFGLLRARANPCR